MMGNSIVINKPNIANNQDINAFVRLKESSKEFTGNKSFFKILTSEGCESFANYIDWLGISKDDNPVILSSLHHYYFDAEEMKNIKTVINLKELNQMKDIKSFFNSLFNILSQNTNFIGRFVDNKKNSGYELKNNSSYYQNKKNFENIENGIVSRNPILNMLYSFMDSKTNKYMSENSVSLMLEEHGFRVLDMTELNGYTYFFAQKNKA